MADSPIRITIVLEHIEPNDRLHAAVDVLAAAELIDETAEVGGYVVADDLVINRDKGVWTEMRPGVKGSNIEMPPRLGM